MTDITKYKFSDEDIISVSICVESPETIILDVSDNSDELYLTKSDAIAIAKHFKLIEVTETDYLLTGANGNRLREPIGQMETTEYD